MCDENCTYMVKLARAITRIGELDFENSELQDRISELEKKLNCLESYRTIIDTPDASDSEATEVKNENPTPNPARFLPKPAALFTEVKPEPLNLSTPRESKRETKGEIPSSKTFEKQVINHLS